VFLLKRICPEELFFNVFALVDFVGFFWVRQAFSGLKGGLSIDTTFEPTQLSRSQIENKCSVFLLTKNVQKHSIT